MKNKLLIYPLTLMVMVLIITNSCKKDKVNNINNNNINNSNDSLVGQYSGSQRDLNNQISPFNNNLTIEKISNNEYKINGVYGSYSVSCTKDVHSTWVNLLFPYPNKLSVGNGRYISNLIFQANYGTNNNASYHLNYKILEETTNINYPFITLYQMTSSPNDFIKIN